MIKWIAITVLSGGLLGGISGYAPEAQPLVPGQIYRTGSPYSQPGIIGLLGGIAGTHRGGGYEQWNGPYVGPNDNAWEVVGSWTPATEAQHRAQNTSLTLEEAQAAFSSASGNKTQNRPRATVPNCEGRLFVTWVVDSELGARAQYSCEE